MALVLYVVLGIFIGVIGITIIGFYLSKKDNKKLDDSLKTDVTISFKADTWPNDVWKSETTYAPKDFSKKLKTPVKKKTSKKEDLENELKEAVSEEDYEKAAILRDKINKLK